FIETGDEEYIKSNLVISTFLSLRINLMSFINSSGQSVFSKAFDLDTETVIPISPGLEKFLSGDFPLLEQTGTEVSKSGIILLEEAPMIITAQPILTSQDMGPARGTVIFGRYLDSIEIDRLSQLTLLNISICPINDVHLYPDFTKSLQPLLTGTPIFVNALSQQQISSYVLIEDIYGNPALVIRIVMPRDIYQQGQDNIATYTLMILGISLLCAGGFFLILQGSVFSRLTRLIKGIETVVNIKNLSTRLPVDGSDELATVTGTINGMLAALEESATELEKRYEQEKGLRQEVENEMRRRVEFTRALVHELKTPVTPVMAASELMLEESKGKTERNLAQIIHRGALNLNRRIDELLDLARSEIGTLHLDLTPTDITQRLKDIVNDATPLALEKEQRLSLELPGPLPVMSVDAERLTQVIQNLINNALKFTPDGGTITLRAIVDEANLVVEVNDTGHGLTKEQQDRLFDPYHRLPGDRERFSGLGLGLALSKNFIELHGGKIWVKSRRGYGSTFGFSIPIESV
ncbi:CHASE4 domain-containing protein, partial [Chloroflexota bacterium]